MADEHPRHRIYNKIKARKGEKVAIVATARHLAESVYWVLIRKEYYKGNRAIRASSFNDRMDSRKRKGVEHKSEGEMDG